MFVIIVQPRVFYNLKKSMLCKHYGKEQNNSCAQQNLKNLSIHSVDDDDAQDFPALKTHMNIKIQSHTVQKTKVSYCEPPLKLNFNSSSQGVNCHQCSLWTFFKISRSTEIPILHHLEIFQDSFGLVPISVKRNLIWYFYWNNLHYSKRVFRYS